MFWFAEGLGRKARDQGQFWLPGLGNVLDKPQSPSGLCRGPKGELLIEKILSIAMEVCRTHAQQKPLSNASCRITCSCLPAGWHPFLWFDLYQERTSAIVRFYFITTTITDTQGIGKILLFFNLFFFLFFFLLFFFFFFFCTHYSNGICTIATRTGETSPAE